MEITSAELVFWAVVLSRLLVPLLIPRFPLPAILACLIIDGVDQSIFQAIAPDADLTGYQSYDKALDIYYLVIAYIATLRNWTNQFAVSIARFLIFWRLVGVVFFELGVPLPPMLEELLGERGWLFIFPNTFEYFFIAYEAIRLRWDPRRFGTRFWLLVAAGIWVLVKLPQEYWIHVAQLDFTDTWRDVPWFAPVITLGVLGLLAIAWFVVRPRLPAADHGWTVAPPPLPAEMDSAAERDAWTAAHVRLWSWWTAEKVLLIGLLSTIYARILPDLEVSDLRMFVGISVFVVVNAAISLAVARHIGSRTRLGAAFAARVGVNVGLALVARLLLGGGALSLTSTVFFVLLVSLLVTYHDRFAPVAAARRRLDTEDPQPGPRAVDRG